MKVKMKILVTAGLSMLLSTNIAIAQSSGMADDNKMKDNPKMKMMTDIKNWPDASKLAAAEITEKYGMPDEATEHMLVWYNNGPWKRTVIYNMETKHIFPVDHADVMEQFIDYNVPEDKYDELAMYDGSVTVRRTDGEMSAKCDKEGANFLAINLANDVATGKKNVEEARAFYAKTIKEFALENKMAPYLKEFQFKVDKKGTEDADKRAFSTEENEKITAAMKKKNMEMMEKMKMEMEKMKAEMDNK
ncbi:MAG: hypothetical protein H7Y00_06350 [Fimbriimonadaceae bacterium]|nr:hypothetical protein [Chitinophagales bacterium]